MIVRKKTMEDVAKVVADVSDVVSEYVQSAYGAGEEEARESFKVTVERNPRSAGTSADGDDRVTVIVDSNLTSQDFFSIADKLDESLSAVDVNAYFTYQGTGTFSSVLNLRERELSGDPDSVVNYKNVSSAVDAALKQVGKSLEEEFKAVSVVLTPDEDDDTVHVYAEAESDDYSAVATCDVVVSDVVSAYQLRADLVEEMYAKFINSVVEK